jgi:hypothetical protein
MTMQNVRLSEDHIRQLDDAERALAQSLEAHEKMREVCFNEGWWKAGQPSDNGLWNRDLRRIQVDARTYISKCVDVAAEAAWPLGELEPLSESLRDMAADIENRVLAMINRRDLPELEPYILGFASERASGCVLLAKRQFKPMWMRSPGPPAGEDESTAAKGMNSYQPAATECEPIVAENISLRQGEVPVGVEGKDPWNKRLRAARVRAKLSRPGAANKLKTHGVQLTPDAIKKHEEGAAMPRPEVRQAYSVIYATAEATLFS